MSTNAEGGHDGITTEGPDNKFDGVGSHPEVDNCGPITSPTRITMPWKTGQGAPPASRYALGANRPD